MYKKKGLILFCFCSLFFLAGCSSGTYDIDGPIPLQIVGIFESVLNDSDISNLTTWSSYKINSEINNISFDTSGFVNGSGTTNTIPKWTSSKFLGDSIITESGNTITINDNLIVNTEIETPKIVFNDSSIAHNWEINISGNNLLIKPTETISGANQLGLDAPVKLWESYIGTGFITTPLMKFDNVLNASDASVNVGFGYSPIVNVNGFVFSDSAVTAAGKYTTTTGQFVTNYFLFRGTPTFTSVIASQSPVSPFIFSATPTMEMDGVSNGAIGYAPQMFQSISNFRALNGGTFKNINGKGYTSKAVVFADEVGDEVEIDVYSHFETQNSGIGAGVGIKTISLINGLNMLDDTRALSVNGIKSLISSGSTKFFINHEGTAKSFFNGNITLSSLSSLCFINSSSCIYQNGDVLNITSPYVYGQNSSWLDVTIRTDDYDESKFGKASTTLVDMTNVRDVNGNIDHTKLSDVGKILRQTQIIERHDKITTYKYECEKVLTQEYINTHNITPTQIIEIENNLKENPIMETFDSFQENRSCISIPSYTYIPVYKTINISEHSLGKEWAKHEQILYDIHEVSDYYIDAQGIGTVEIKDELLAESIRIASPKIDKSKDLKSLKDPDMYTYSDGNVKHDEFDSYKLKTSTKKVKNPVTGVVEEITESKPTIDISYEVVQLKREIAMLKEIICLKDKSKYGEMCN